MSKRLGPWKVKSVTELGELKTYNGFQIMDTDEADPEADGCSPGASGGTPYCNRGY